jgi:hypothetical protein
MIVLQVNANTRQCQTKARNRFDDLPALAAPKRSELRNELDSYLLADAEHTSDVLGWWHERRTTYPRLSRMAMDYLTIPGTY